MYIAEVIALFIIIIVGFFVSWALLTAPFTYEDEDTNSAPFPRGNRRH